MSRFKLVAERSNKSYLKMSGKIQIINPLNCPNWDELLVHSQNYSFFHSSAWARVLCESYDYKPLYFVSLENGRFSALIPLMEVNSFLTGKRGVSLPFTDYCQPVVSAKINFQEIVDETIKYGKKAGWKYIEWRGGESNFQATTPSSFYYVHTLDLIQNEEEILSGFRNSTKRNIQKAIRNGVDISINNSLESVKAFYRLHCITRKHHGLPPQPYHFLKKVYEHIISKQKGLVVLASYQKSAIAGAICFSFGKKAIYKYGASDKRYQHLRPSNLVMWETIKWYVQNGFKSFSLGRTEMENIGLLQYKKGWDVKEQIINYYVYDMKKEKMVSRGSRYDTLYKVLLGKLPLPLLNFVGTLLYKHAG